MCLKDSYSEHCGDSVSIFSLTLFMTTQKTKHQYYWRTSKLFRATLFFNDPVVILPQPYFIFIYSFKIQANHQKLTAMCSKKCSVPSMDYDSHFKISKKVETTTI